MVEVLVSLLLMTIGLLGISGLMLSGVNNSTGMDLSSRAGQSASQIMDAMRANPANAASYVTSYGVALSTLSGTTPQDNDRKLWLEAVRRLPGGDGTIQAGAAAGQYIVSIRFTQCLGTLGEAEAGVCAAAVADSDKRVISFSFKI